MPTSLRIILFGLLLLSVLQIAYPKDNNLRILQTGTVVVSQTNITTASGNSSSSQQSNATVSASANESNAAQLVVNAQNTTAVQTVANVNGTQVISNQVSSVNSTQVVASNDATANASAAAQANASQQAASTSSAQVSILQSNLTVGGEPVASNNASAVAPNVTTPAVQSNLSVNASQVAPSNSNLTAPVANVSANVSTNVSVNETASAANVTAPLANLTVSANVTAPVSNLTVPAANVSTPAVNVTLPAANVTVPAVNVTAPAVNVTLPAVNVTVPAVNVTTPVSTVNVTVPATPVIKPVNIITPNPNVTVTTVSPSAVLPDALLWPAPQSIQVGTGAGMIVYPKMFYNYQLANSSGVDGRIIYWLDEIFDQYRRAIFVEQCADANYFNERQKEVNNNTEPQQAVIQVIIKNTTFDWLGYDTSENYTLSINPNVITITADTFFGVVRALETFAQLIQSQEVTQLATLQTINKVPCCGGQTFESQEIVNRYFQYFIAATPITVSDSPDFVHRGILIDVSKHFLTIGTLQLIIQGMMSNKMNVLHLHLSDSQSFPLQLITNPNITTFGAYSPAEIYSVQDILRLVQYAQVRGVRLIPEIKGGFAMGLAPGLSSILACGDVLFGSVCDEPPCGQLDPTVQLTYTTLKGIYADLSSLFPDSAVHLAGDLQSSACYLSKPSIVTFLQTNNLDVIQLQNLFRAQMRNVTDPIKRKIYFTSINNSLSFQGDDIAQYNGLVSDIPATLAKLPLQQFIISASDVFGLNAGMSDVYGNQDVEGLITWLMMYQQNLTFSGQSAGQILGAETTLYSTVQNSDSVLANVWMRVAAMAELTWNSEAKLVQNAVQVIARLVAQYSRMRARGLQVTPFTNEYCERNIARCFQPVSLV